MYNETITLFNRYKSRLGDRWYATIIEGVDLNLDRAYVVQTYGIDSADNGKLHIKYADGCVISGKQYLPPKEWSKQLTDLLPDTLTFNTGDFILKGAWDGETIINDDDYTESFYHEMNTKYDFVLAITSVAKYDCIPHFEIMLR